jgi:mRNA interferase MazF
LSPTTSNGLTKKSRADTFQVTSIDQVRLTKKLGQLPEPVMEEIVAGIAICVEYK